MKRYLIIGGVVVALLVIVGVAFLGQPAAQPEEGSEPGASSQQQSGTTERSSGRSQGGLDDDTRTDDSTAQYIDYSQESFAEHADSQRVLVFTSTTDQTSSELDTLLTSSLAELPSDVVMFKTDTDKHADIADQFGAQPGVAIKFNTDGRLGGIYVAPESPDLAIFVTSLQLDEESTDSPAAN